MAKQLETAVFGGGCFWCTEAVFQSLRGVERVVPGYAGGENQRPSYEEVSTGETGHAEVIKVDFDPEQISYRDLLNVFFGTHNPTEHNRQGNDVGSQYRSAIFFSDDRQKREAQALISELTSEQVFDRPIVTTVEPLKNFSEAEDYHKNYYQNNPNQPYCQAVISPKVAKLREKFKHLLR